MGPNISGSGIKTSLVVTAQFSGLRIVTLSANGKKEICMALVVMSLQMARDMRASTWMIKSTVMGSTSGLTSAYIKVTGRVASSTDLLSTKL